MPFDGDAVVELGLLLIRYVGRTAKIGIVTMGAITEKCLLNIPVFQNEIRIHPGHPSTVSRGIRSEVGRELDIARTVGVPHP